MVKCTYEQSAKRTSSPCYSKYMSSYLKSLRSSNVQVSALKLMALTTRCCCDVEGWTEIYAYENPQP